MAYSEYQIICEDERRDFQPNIPIDDTDPERNPPPKPPNDPYEKYDNLGKKVAWGLFGYLIGKAVETVFLTNNQKE